MAAVFMVVWILFFDETSFLSQQDKLEELNGLQKKRAYYIKEIDIARQELKDIKNNPESVEKFARENYFMKKSGEDVFIIEYPQP